MTQFLVLHISFFLSLSIMLTIPGATGKTQALFDFLTKLQVDSLLFETDKNTKRIKLENGSAAAVATPTEHLQNMIEFPLTLHDVDMATQSQLATELSKYEDQRLFANCNYTSLDDSQFASLQIFSKQDQQTPSLLLVENECIVMRNEFSEEITEHIDHVTHLLMALVFLMHTKSIVATKIQLKQSSLDNTPLSLYMAFDYSIESKNKSMTPLLSVVSKKLGLPKPVTLLRDPSSPHASTSQSTAQISLPSTNTLPRASSETAPLSEPTPPPPSVVQKLPPLSRPVSLLDFDPTSTVSFPSAELPTHHSAEAFLRYLQPPVSDTVLSNYVSPSIVAELTPFQTQNVEWMMAREAHYADDKGLVQPNNAIFEHLPLLYAGNHLDNQKGHYLNLLTDTVLTDRSKINELIKQSFRGGILADEMGLGKTISVLALIAKHKLNQQDPFHPHEDKDLLVSPGTLIIAPGPIISQWSSEIEKHAPGLSYFVYQGRRVHPDIDNEALLQYDIVLTHYEAFRHEIYYTKPLPKRPQRSGVAYKRQYQMSPLVSIRWFRCILDEAQMIDASLSHVSAVAKLIPSWYRWAVTGTPLKDDLNNLYSLYDFLELEDTLTASRFETFCQRKSHFYPFAKQTIRRNMKSKLKDQVHIPHQSRHVVHIPFSTVEQHYYEDLWRDCRQELRLDWFDSIHWTLPENAHPATAQTYHALRLKMRQWLLALRQACIHPSMITNASMRLGYQPSGYNKKAQSMDQVLDYMHQSAEEQLDGNQHAYYLQQLKKGGMYECLQSWQEAIDLYLTHLVPVEQLVNHYQTHKLSLSEQEKNSSTRRVYRWQMLLHRYYFYAAGVYHVLERKDQEEIYYDKASQLRRSLMESYTSKVFELMHELEKTADHVGLKEEYLLGARTLDMGLLDAIEYEDDHLNDSDHEDAQSDDSFQLRNQRASDLNMLENVKGLGDVLDCQLRKIVYIREQMMPLLKKSLVDNQNETDEVTGDEYERSLNEQEMCQVYLSAYQNLLEDRRFIVKGTTVNAHETMPVEGLSHMSTEAKSVEQVEKAYRHQLKQPGFEIECIKDVESELRALKQRIHKDPNHLELYRLIDVEHQHLVSHLPYQHKLMDALENDFKRLNQLFNSRVAYYKYLQTISDTLTEWSHPSPQAEIERLNIALEKLEEKIAQGKSRTLYFKALLEEQEALNKTPKECLICQESFEKGLITYCGHICCHDCGMRWFKTSQRCHTCNSPVRANEWYTISYKRTEMRNKDMITKPQETVPTDLMKEIEKQCIIEGQGAKLDAIIRHIKYIKTMSNGKCVVFSQWAKVLDMLKQGLKANDIKFLSLNTGAALNRNNVTKFQNDPDINVILLHARSQSSGLTLVAAQTVFIIEPVLNEAMEKQAINRIHRIGQTKETSVFWYIVQDTIEERIQAIHDVKRQTEPETTQVLSTMADGGGEFVSNDDIQRCFTGDPNFV
ncbi:SNF2 family N-terminal domain-containing protein [Choanephora cucurbitarum]|nr:SNF2 family N-terminal domain-containing protein [Choanephora cucurbitarum]